jgi:hypothetical protein
MDPQEGQEDTQPTEQQDEAAAIAELTAGFEGTPTETPAEPKTAEQEPQAAAPAEPPAPKYAQITEEQLAELTARAARVDELVETHKRDRDTIFGTMGGLQRSINSRQVINLPKEKLDAIRADLPEVAEALEAMAQATTSPVFDTEQVLKSAEERLKPTLDQIRAQARDEALTTARQEMRSELLSQVHPDWRKDSESPEFQTFVKAQGADFVGRLHQASLDWDHRVIGSALTQWKEAKKKADTTATTRRDRFEANVNPRGTTAPVQGVKSEAEEVMEGFNSPR